MTPGDAFERACDRIAYGSAPWRNEEGSELVDDAAREDAEERAAIQAEAGHGKDNEDEE